MSPLYACAASDVGHHCAWLAVPAKHCGAVPLGGDLQPDPGRPLAVSFDPVQPPSGKLTTRCHVCCGAERGPCLASQSPHHPCKVQSDSSDPEQL